MTPTSVNLQAFPASDDKKAQIEAQTGLPSVKI